MEQKFEIDLLKKCNSEYVKLAEVLIRKSSNKRNQHKAIGILSGLGGEAAFLLHYSKISAQPIELGYSYLQQALDNITKHETLHTHCSGLAGLGWSIMHLQETGLLEADVNLLLGNMDIFLERSLKKDIGLKNWDFLHGAIGVAFYFLKRRKYTKENDSTLHFFIEAMQAMCEKDGNSLKWPSLNKEDNKIIYNISLSHGMSAFVAFLSKVHKMGIQTDVVKNMLNGSVKYILQQELDINLSYSYFPSYSIESNEDLRSSRLAWCYGDLGIASALWLAGDATCNCEWKNKAVEVLLHAAKRRDNTITSIKDTSICHGTAGVAHIFNRAYYNTGINEFKEARDFWLNATIKMASFSDGLGGYKAWGGNKEGYINETNLLEGISGIGLAFLSVLHPQYMNWDECLLLS